MNVQMKMVDVIICVLMNMVLTTVSVVMDIHLHLIHTFAWVRVLHSYKMYFRDYVLKKWQQYNFFCVLCLVFPCLDM